VVPACDQPPTCKRPRAMPAPRAGRRPGSSPVSLGHRQSRISERPSGFCQGGDGSDPSATGTLRAGCTRRDQEAASEVVDQCSGVAPPALSKGRLSPPSDLRIQRGTGDPEVRSTFAQHCPIERAMRYPHVDRADEPQTELLLGLSAGDELVGRDNLGLLPERMPRHRPFRLAPCHSTSVPRTPRPAEGTCLKARSGTAHLALLRLGRAKGGLGQFSKRVRPKGTLP
jgi:hypothetical protein